MGIFSADKEFLQAKINLRRREVWPMTVKDFGAGSRYSVRLAKGCRMCKRGAKMVLLVTGRCDAGCFYCPISTRKRGRDVIYANELRASNMEEVLHEARMIDARGTGITGGDPLRALDRTVEHIASLKDAFGPAHHIHLYTATIDRKAFERLAEAGLDELRVHPPPRQWSRPERTGLAEAARDLGIPVGIEVPAIPGHMEELGLLIRYASDAGLDFVNLNELEFSETNAGRMLKRGFAVKDDVSSAAAGSEEMAIELVGMSRGIPVHYCSSSFKDSIQLRRRLLRRARNAAHPGDIITEDGTLLKGIIELRTAEAIGVLEKEGVPRRLFRMDHARRRLEIAPWVLEELAAQMPAPCYVVEEYPTADRLEVERRQI
jgi:pyruvate formate-lyase activating enzyme-like uncharacterized protein